MGNTDDSEAEEIGSPHESRDVPSDDARRLRGHDGGHNEAPPAQRTSSLVQHSDASLEEYRPIPEKLNSLPGTGQPALPEFQIASAHLEVANGPIPPPTMLQMYGEVSPDLPDRIMRMAENDQQAQIEILTGNARAEQFAVRIGALTSPLLVVALVVASIVLFHNGQHAGALAALASGLTVWLVPTLKELRRPTEESEKPVPLKRSSDSSQ